MTFKNLPPRSEEVNMIREPIIRLHDFLNGVGDIRARHKILL
ncbi:hypothetical protein RchiOBHm_Chr5g0022671 [Rosa chinensis]|uniref:Uncharacterized protein n=1 Tax=Rosa chinensis TaxID=74649 RepID=A0A2P6Q7V6_ROSCH|nr:hypothetical protein RchiOBHm_Chr5g0022671 [Rosa chinensis]